MKLQVNVNDCLCDRIDRVCASTGLTRSGLCAAIIALYLPEWERKMSIPSIESESDSIEQLTIEK